MKKLILISVLLLFTDVHANDHSPEIKMDYPSNYRPDYMYLIEARSNKSYPPLFPDIVCIIMKDFDEQPFEIHLSFDKERKNLIWMKRVSDEIWRPYSQDGATQTVSSNALPPLEKFFIDYLYVSSSGVIELKNYTYQKNYSTESEAFIREKYSISLYTSKVSYYYRAYPPLTRNDVTVNSMGDCKFITLPKYLEEEENKETNKDPKKRKIKS